VDIPFWKLNESKKRKFLYSFNRKLNETPKAKK